MLAVTSCTSYNHTVNYTASIDLAAFMNKVAPDLAHTAFMIDVGLVRANGKESLNMIVGFVEPHDCAGTLHYKACSLEAAIGEYDVQMENDAIPIDTIGKPVFLHFANNTQVKHHFVHDDLHSSTLGGIASIGLTRWQTGIVYYQSGGKIQEVMWGGGLNYQSYRHFEGDQLCAMTIDPSADVIDSMNSLVFYTGAIAPKFLSRSYIQSHIDPGLDPESVVTGHIKGVHEIYQTDLIWFLAAAIIEGICIALILPTYFGYWKLGRPVSFSPLEISKAFEAPLLADCNSNSSGRDIASSVGLVRVQYGTVRSSPGTTKLAFAEPAAVQPPQKGSRFDV